MTDARGLLDRLRRRRDAYARMLAAARAAEPGDVAPLLAEVEALDRSIAPVREQWDAIRPTLDPAALREVEAVVEETRRTLGELVGLLEAGPPALGALLGARAARAAYGG
jgi:hypothetical protein